LKPVFYDFKRGLLRPSVLIALVIFMLAGAGFAYLIIGVLATTPSSSTIVYSSIDPESKLFSIEALFITPELELTQGALSYSLYYTSGGGRITLTTGALQGVGRVLETKTLSGLPSQPSQIYIELEATTKVGSYRTISYYTPFNYNNKTIYMTYSSRYITAPGRFFNCFNGTTIPVKEAVSIIPMGQPESCGDRFYLASFLLANLSQGSYRFASIIFLHDKDNLTYDLYFAFNATQVPSSIDYTQLNSSFIYIGQVKPGLSFLEIRLENINFSLPEVTPIVISLAEQSGQAVNQSLPPEPVAILVSRSQYGLIVGATIAVPQMVDTSATRKLVANAMAGQSGLGLFSTFYPVLMLYLAYVYIAKPRSAGALEFLLARPLTRLDLYTTRFLSGVLVALASTGLFFASTSLTLYVLTGILLDFYSYLILFAGVAASLVAFYSVCYAIAAFTRGGSYLALSIFIYLFYTIGYPLIVYFVTISQGIGPGLGEAIARNTYIAQYFSPLGATSFAQYYFASYNNIPTIGAGAAGVVNIWLVIASVLSWIIVPVTVGWLVFKRANLLG
jgi:ABC-2 type transport system permease protein